MSSKTPSRKERAKQTAEVFTPPWFAHRMLSKLPDETWAEEKTFLDPACGNGNLLIAVVTGKIACGHSPLSALITTYGVDIMEDNIREACARLLRLTGVYENVTEKHIRAVLTNTVRVDMEKYPNGSLDYNYVFDGKNVSEKDIEIWKAWVNNTMTITESLPVRDVKCNDRGFLIFEEDGGDYQ